MLSIARSTGFFGCLAGKLRYSLDEEQIDLDGKFDGYYGIQTDKLPHYVQFVAISDVFTALIAKRPYKEAWPPEEALDYIRSKAYTQFAPELVGVFLPLVRDDSRVAAVFSVMA
jgi:HD-GYP domain-containing protein (c-di-GMP phosphodiesterase class II)